VKVESNLYYPSEDQWVIMKHNLHAGSMKQSRQNILEQNPCLMKSSAKNVSHWACLPSKASITNEMRESDSVYKLHSMVNENYPIM
jgi:hypothetical protein